MKTKYKLIRISHILFFLGGLFILFVSQANAQTCNILDDGDVNPSCTYVENDNFKGCKASCATGSTSSFTCDNGEPAKKVQTSSCKASNTSGDSCDNNVTCYVCDDSGGGGGGGSGHQSCGEVMGLYDSESEAERVCPGSSQLATGTGSLTCWVCGPDEDGGNAADPDIPIRPPTTQSCPNGTYTSCQAGYRKILASTNPLCYYCLAPTTPEPEDPRSDDCWDGFQKDPCPYGQDTVAFHTTSSGERCYQCVPDGDEPDDYTPCPSNTSKSCPTGQIATATSYTDSDGNQCFTCQGPSITNGDCTAPNAINNEYGTLSSCLADIPVIGQTSYTYTCEPIIKTWIETVETSCPKDVEGPCYTTITRNETCYTRNCSDSGSCKTGVCDAEDTFAYSGTACIGNTGIDLCGECCTSIAAPWFQTVGGNLYAQNNISGQIGFDLNSSTEYINDGTNPNQFVNAYLARQAGDFTTNLNGNSSGIPIAYGNSITNTLDNQANYTQRQNKNAAATQSLGYPQLRQENYDYFINLLRNEEIEFCNANLIGGTDITNEDGTYNQVCKTTGNLNIANTEIQVPAGQKQTIFVNGDLIIGNQARMGAMQDTNTSIEVAEGGYLAFIVSGDITFKTGLGSELIEGMTAYDTFKTNQNAYPTANFLVKQSANGALPTNTNGYNLPTPQIQGIFIADGTINFPSVQTEIGSNGHFYNNYYTNMPCDNKLTLAGSYLGWGDNNSNNGINIRRTFKGCMAEPLRIANGNATNYPDYNEFNPVLTFEYRPDLIQNTPDWMKHTVQIREEVN